MPTGQGTQLTHKDTLLVLEEPQTVVRKTGVDLPEIASETFTTMNRNANSDSINNSKLTKKD